MTQIPTVDLGGGVAMPMVGFGTWQLGGRRAYEAVRYALEVGYRHLDTATMYRNEHEVGQALRDSGLDRGEVFVTTKLQPGNAGRARATLAESLRALDTSYVDLWLIHWPPRRQASVPLWREFLALRDEGQCRSVGVSNYGIAQIDELIAATGQRPAVNQIASRPASRLAPRPAPTTPGARVLPSTPDEVVPPGAVVRQRPVVRLASGCGSRFSCRWRHRAS
jgi:2,5-diketo-D-gluconate reductase A